MLDFDLYGIVVAMNDHRLQKINCRARRTAPLLSAGKYGCGRIPSLQ